MGLEAEKFIEPVQWPEVEPPELVQEILNDYEKIGQIDLQKMTSKQLKAFFDYFAEQSTNFDIDFQTQAMEQIIASQAVSMDKIKKVLSAMPDQAKADIAEFIGKTLDTQQFYPLFHFLFDELSSTQQVYFIDYYTKKEPENAIMVAPFSLYKVTYDRWGMKDRQIDLTDIKLNEEDISDPKKPYLLENYYNDFKSLKDLFEAVLEYGNRRAIKRYLDFFDRTHKTDFNSFVMPYLPDLIEKEVMTEEEAKDILLNSGFMAGSFYLNDRQKKQKDKIYQKFYNGEDLSITEAKDFGQLDDQIKAKATHHIFENFEFYKQILSEQELIKFIDNLIGNGLPVLLEFDKFKDDQQLLKHFKLFDLRYQYHGMTDYSDLAILAENGFEKEVFKIFSDIIYIADCNTEFVANLDKMLDIFSADNRKKLIDLIAKQEPQMLLIRMDIAFIYNLEIDKLLKSGQERSYQYIPAYNHVIYNLRKNYSGQEFKDKKRIYDAQIKKIFLADTFLILDYPEISQLVFSKKEIKGIIDDNIDNRNLSFIEQCMNKYDDKDKNKIFKALGVSYLKNKLKNVIIEDQTVFNTIVGETVPHSMFQTVIKLISPRMFLQLAFKDNQELDFSELSDNPYFEEFMLKHNSYQSQLLAQIDNGNQYETIYNLVRSLERRQEDKELPEADKEKVSKFFVQAKEKYYQMLERNPFEIFNDRGYGRFPLVGDGKIKKLINNNIDEYFKLFPDNWQVIRRFKESEYIDEEKFQQLIMSKANHIAFEKDFYELDDKMQSYEMSKLEDLEDEQRQEIINKNPILQVIIERQAIKPEQAENWDFYEQVLSKLEGLEFYELYKKKLQKIAKKEMATYGSQSDLSIYHKNENFFKLAQRLAILDYSPLAKNNKQVLNGLPAKEREEIFNLQEVLYLYNLDEYFINIEITKDNLNEVKDQLYQRIINHLAQILELDLDKIDTTKRVVSLGAIKPLIKYYLNVCKNKPELENIYKGLVTAWLSGNYEQHRMTGTEQDINEKQILSQLKKEKLVPAKMTEGQFAGWQAESSSQLDTFLDYDITGFNKDIRQVFRQAVADEHIEEDDLPKDADSAKNRYQALYLPLQEFSKRQKELSNIFNQVKKNKVELDKKELAGLQAEFQGIKKEIAGYLEENGELIKEAEARLYVAKLQNLTNEELKEEAIFIDKKRVALSKVFKIINEYYQSNKPDFITDINRVRQILQEYKQRIFGDKKVSRSQLFITDKVDFEVNIRIGELPVPTCQNYDSESRLNKGLLSYLADPNVKIIQIYNEEGSLIARSVLRLLADKNNKPQLFLERIYTVNPHATIDKAIIGFAKQKAKKMGAKLYSHSAEIEQQVSEDYELTDLTSQASRASHVYTDAGGGLMKNGEYSVRNAFCLSN